MELIISLLFVLLVVYLVMQIIGAAKGNKAVEIAAVVLVIMAILWFFRSYF